VVWKPDYLTVAAYNAWKRLDDTVDDTEVAGFITAASRAIDGRCNRQFGQLAAPAARVFRQPSYFDRDTGFWRLDIVDVQDTTALTIDGQTLAASGVVMLPENAPADGEPYTALGYSATPTYYAGQPRAAVTVVARWGWTAVPAQVVAACKLQTSRFLTRRNSPNGLEGSPTDGTTRRVLARLDPDVATSLIGVSRRRRPS
jgi:hypothetical protein